MSPTGRWLWEEAPRTRAVGMMSPVTIIPPTNKYEFLCTFRMRKKTQLSHWPESVHSNTLQTRSSPTPPRQLWLLWNIGKWQSFHHCLAIQRYQNWQVQKNQINMQCIIQKKMSHIHTMPSYFKNALVWKRPDVWSSNFSNFPSQGVLALGTCWAQKSSASWFFLGTWSHFH